MGGQDYNQLKGKRVNLAPGLVQIGPETHNLNEVLECGEVGPVPLNKIGEVAAHYLQLSGGAFRPQLAALVCAATGDLRAMEFYFPITRSLDQEERAAFFRLVASIISHPNFRLRVMAEHRTEVTRQIHLDIPAMVAGHLAETYFYRPDILDRFISSPRNFWFYTNPVAFEQGGGLAGGDYNPEKEAVELTLSRLYEGYDGPTPGVAPFLHELGHMLDHFDCPSLKLRQSKGTLPGLNPEDGPLFISTARQKFIRGKKLERDRYDRYQTRKAREGESWPVGHPYVFQNDTEFIAGYFEMFFRNPNYFAAQNPELFEGFTSLFRQDPRRYWPQDFYFYRDENKKVYLERQEIWKQKISIPAQ